MAKLAAVKEKLAGLKAQLLEKADKIAFIKSWREKQAAKAAPAGAPGAAKGPDPASLGAIYRDGSTATRLQVIAFYVFVAVALVSAGSLVRKVVVKMRSSAEHEKVGQDISHGLAETKRKAEERAELLALGQFTTNVYVGQGGERMMTVDLWVRVSDPEAAALVNSRNEVFRDKTMDALNALFTGKVNLLQDEGKKAARERIRAALNGALTHGKVEEVFIQNLVVQ